LNRHKKPGWKVSLATPGEQVTSMNGVTLHGQCSLAEACQADAVLVGSGIRTRDIAADPAMMAQLRFDPSRQLIGAQCSGALLLARLGLLAGLPACTDSTTAPWLSEAGVQALPQAFHASGNIATAGGCLASQYLAAWVLARLDSSEAARAALHYVAPIGEKEDYANRALSHITPYL